MNRRNLLLGLAAACAVPAGIYGIPRLREMFEGAQPQPVASADALTQDELALVGAISEGIIPATDAPGALGAGVPQFIELIYAEWFLPVERTAFRAGLKTFDEDSRRRFGKLFASLTADQQYALLVDWDDAAATEREKGSRTLPPFAQMKSLVVVGYYTSKVGQIEELKTVLDGGENNPGGPVMMPLPFNL